MTKGNTQQIRLKKWDNNATVARCHLKKLLQKK